VSWVRPTLHHFDSSFYTAWLIYLKGLQTALELLKRNIRVILQSPHPPLHSTTCSQGSGALWTPYKCDDVRVSGKWAMETLDYLLTSYSLKTSSSWIEMVPTLHLKKSVTNGLPLWTQDPRLRFEQLNVSELYRRYSNSLRLPEEKEVLQAGYTHAWFFHPPVVNAPFMLQVSFFLLIPSSLCHGLISFHSNRNLTCILIIHDFQCRTCCMKSTIILSCSSRTAAYPIHPS